MQSVSSGRWVGHLLPFLVYYPTILLAYYLSIILRDYCFFLVLFLWQENREAEGGVGAAWAMNV